MTGDHVYLAHVRDAIERIRQDTSAGRDAFMADCKTQDAVIHHIEVIGEATKNLSPEIREANPDIPWKRIAGMRDRGIHAYFGVDLDLGWAVVEDHLPLLLGRVVELRGTDPT